MKKLLATLSLTTLITAIACAENYPYRSDFLWVTVPDHADWLYETGERAVVDVQLYMYGMACNTDVRYAIGPDMMDADTSGSVTLEGGHCRIDIGTMQEPGFRDLRLTAEVNGEKTEHHVKVGFSVSLLEPYTQEPADFTAFWTANIEEMRSLPLAYTKEKAEEYCTDDIDCYLIKLQVNKRKQSVYGYLFYPKDAAEGSCPVVLCPPGAGIKTIKEPLRHKYYVENGHCIRLEIEIHGLDPRLPAEVFANISRAFNAKENGYLTNNMDNRDDYYMKHVYLACVRCLDLLTSLPEWDGKNVIVQGGSQGGALAIITAALDNKRVTQCVVNHPALSDMARYVTGKAGGYPHFFKDEGARTEQRLRTMAYYDVVNFARHVTAPTFMTWGYNDNTCPPTTSYIVWNTLTCPKEALLTPINEHWTSDVTERRQLDWILEHLSH